MNYEHDYAKPRYTKNAKLFYLDTDSLIVQVMTGRIQRYCRRCYNKIWHFKSLNRQTITTSTKQKINWTNGKLVRWTTHEKIIVRLRALKDNNDEDKKCVRKRTVKFRDHKKCLKTP